MYWLTDYLSEKLKSPTVLSGFWMQSKNECALSISNSVVESWNRDSEQRVNCITLDKTSLRIVDTMLEIGQQKGVMKWL